MARLKITGYLDLDGLDPSQVDMDHKTGLSAQGYFDLLHGRIADLGSLDDLDTLIVDEDEDVLPPYVNDAPTARVKKPRR